MSKEEENAFNQNASIRELQEIYQSMMEQNLHMIYEGEFTQEITKSVLSLTEKSLEHEAIESTVKKKVFNIMIESLQNICKHQYSAGQKTDSGFAPAIFMVGSKKDQFIIITGNMILNSSIYELRKKIDQVNALDADGLKALYKQARLNSAISEVGGAGLGLIDIARKSNNKLIYRFDAISDELSFFSLMTTVSVQKEETD
ncbi:MAG: SiaB family protein kinase [Bacteroidia bacterium]